MEEINIGNFQTNLKSTGLAEGINGSRTYTSIGQAVTLAQEGIIWPTQELSGTVVTQTTRQTDNRIVSLPVTLLAPLPAQVSTG